MRPRKNIVTLQREDNNQDLIDFINLYYNSCVNVEKINEKDFKISCNKDVQLDKFIDFNS